MKKLLLLLFATAAFAQPTTPLSNVQITGTNNHIKSGAVFTADAGSTLVGFPGTGTVTHTLGNLTLNAIVIGNAANDVDVLASLGNAGQVLTSNGVAAQPTWQNAATGSGTVTSIADGSTNGVTWTVATRTTTPVFTFSLGAITPSSVNSVVLSGSSTPTLTVTGTTTVSGTNTGDQTNITGNAGTATTLQTTRAIYGNNFNGSAALTQVIASTFGGTGNGFTKFSGPATSEKTFTLPNASALVLTDASAVTVAQGGTGAATLAAHGVVIGNDTNPVSVTGTGTSGQVLTSNGAGADPEFKTISGTGTVTSVAATVPSLLSISGSPITSSGTLAISYSGTALPIANGGTGRTTGTTAYGLIAAGTTATGVQQTLAAGATTEILVGGGSSALPVWTTATGSGAPVRATSATLVTPALGTPTALVLTNATGLPIAGLTGLGTGVGTFLATPSSANLAAALTDETGSGVAVFGTSPAFTTNFTLANGTAPTTSSVAQTAFDTNAWGSGRGAIQVNDGTAVTYVVATLASDTPTNGQVPTWNTGGTIDWQTPSGSGTVTHTGALTVNQVVVGNASDDIKILAAGTDGYVLTLVSGAPAWAAGGGGGGGIGGSTGSTDNALIRADGTGGATVQSSNVTLADSGTSLVFSGAAGLTATSGAVALTPSGSNRVAITQNANASIGPVITNTNAGSSAIAEIQFTNNIGSTYMGLASSFNSTSFIANYMYMYAPAGSDGVALWWNDIPKFHIDTNGTIVNDNFSVVGTSSFTGNVTSALTVANTIRTVVTGSDMGLYIAGSAGKNRSLYFQTTSTVRGAFYVDDATETGSGNTGSNFWFTNFDDAGSGLNDAFLIYRNTGHVIFGCDYGNYPSDTGAIVQVLGPTSTKSSGTELGLTVTRTYNQTSTAAGTDFLINRTETAVGSGAQLLADMQVGGTSKFKVSRTGGVTMATAAPLSITSGTNQRAGNATLVGGTVTVSNTTVTANTVVMLTRKTSGGTIGTAITYTLSAGASFTITSDNILDTSVFSYFLLEVP